MTGFGRASAQTGDLKITAEVKSLNSKQLDLMMRVPGALREAENNLRNLALQLLLRGKVELTLSLEDNGSESPSALNAEVLERYKTEIAETSERLGIPLPGDWWPILVRMPDAVKVSKRETSESELEMALQAARGAMEALIGFRIAEGRKLYYFFTEKIAEIGRLLDSVEPMEHERVPKIRKRLEEQLAKLDTIEYDRGRLEQEMILYIEKLDVTEEKTRLRSHLSYFLETLGAPEEESPGSGQGKKLGFIAQEMGREINTLGSKSNHAGMQQTVVMMKDALEQIKEQVLNVL